MTKEEKVEELLENEELLEKYKKEYKEVTVSLLLDEPPVPYARERYTRFGGNGKGRFYNKNATYMTRIKKLFQTQIEDESKEIIKTIIDNKDKKKYYVEILGKFYVPIPKSDSVKITAMKEKQLILPDIRRGDIDNYGKLILDVLHDVVYHDDAVVTKMYSEKFYSLHPRVELEITIKYEV